MNTVEPITPVAIVEAVQAQPFPAALPPRSMPILHKGKEVGTRFTIGTMTAKEIKDAGKRLGHTGAKLRAYVHEALTSDMANRMAQAHSAVVHAVASGYVPERIDKRDKSVVLRFGKVAAPKENVKITPDALKEILAKMSPEERAALLA